jgi:SAM-dependent methyltransferase
MDATAWNQRYAGSEMVWSAEPNRFVAEVVEPWPVGRALDMACGEGRNAIWLARLGWQVTAADFSDVAIDKARRLGAANGVDVDWRIADATGAIVEPDSIDLVVICYLQLPDHQMVDVATQAVTSLAPGGAVVVVAHALANLADGVGGPQDPAVLPTPERIEQWFAGLDIERSGHVARPVDTPEGTRDAIDALVVARRPR